MICRKIPPCLLLVASLLASCFLSTTAVAQPGFPLSVTHYDLDLSVDYKATTLSCRSVMEITNNADTAVLQIPLLLYRLMQVSSVADATGRRLHYRQDVTRFDDFGRLQANYIRIDHPVPPRSSVRITVDYDGHLLGYAETGMRYIKEEISPEFTLIRNDTYAYPVIGRPHFRSVVDNLPRQAFDYRLRVTVPDTQVVANGGVLTSQTVPAPGFTTYQYASKGKGWRIDIAIAPYLTLRSEHLGIFYFSEDSVEAGQILDYGNRALSLYTSWWGRLKDDSSITLIETARQSGGQTGHLAILLPKEAFNREGDYEYLFHELSHLWNMPVGEPGRISPRWEEGLAMFCQYLASEKLVEGKQGVLRRNANRALNFMGKEIRKVDALRGTPLIDFGNRGITDYSYTQGMLMFTVLYYWLGEEKFNKALADFYRRYHGKQASAKDLAGCFKKVTRGKRMDAFFDDWMYTTGYGRLVLSGMDIDQIADHYRK